MAKPSINQDKRTRNPHYWKAHVNAFEKSGLSRAEYCRQHELSYHALIYWQRKLSTRQNSKEITLVPVSLGHNIGLHSVPPERAALKVILPDKISIEVGDNFSQATLTRLLVTLESR